MTVPFYVDLVAPQLAARVGDRPLTTRPSPELAHPHQQLTQTGPVQLGDELVARGILLPGVTLGDSCVSTPGARAFHLDPPLARGPASAFQCGTEFAHVHPSAEGSLHMTLPPLVHAEVLAAGWGEPHPISGTMLVYSPRNRRELEIVWQLVIASYRHALGEGEQEANP
jgi:hypothetical protein